MKFYAPWIDEKTREHHLLRAPQRLQTPLFQEVASTLQERHALLDRFSTLENNMLIFSLLTLHAEDLEQIFHNIYQRLAPGGLFMGATFGNNTLKELRMLFQTVEEERAGSITPRFCPLPSGPHIVNILQNQGFKDIVVDQEFYRGEYTNLQSLYYELRMMGETNCLKNRRQGLTTPRFFEACESFHRSHFSKDGKFFVSFEIIYITAWKAL